MRNQYFRTKITDLFKIKHPILCGGLMWLGNAEYAAAAVNSGGMGFITAKTFPDPAEFKDELSKAWDLTSGQPFGVNLYQSMRPEENEVLNGHLKIALDSGVRHFETAGLPPTDFLPQLKEANSIVLHKVSTVRHAVSAARKLDIDAITIVGAECGGHPGLELVSSLVQAVVGPDQIEIPVVIGGGIGHGRQIAAVLGMGAEAVLVGTRVLVAEEVWSHPEVKKQVVNAGAADSTLVMASFRNTSRVMINEYALEVQKLEDEGIEDFEQYWDYVKGSNAFDAYKSGDWNKALLSMGQAAAFANTIVPMEEIFDTLIDEATAAIERISSLTQ
jgi:NAD(P)H-dependent flavin oxidoreductase YrpB (nitropropane dioxygenase family)